MKTVKIIAIIFIITGIAIMVHQVIYWRVWFETDDFFHHESFIVIFMVLGITLLVLTPFMSKKRKKRK